MHIVAAVKEAVDVDHIKIDSATLEPVLHLAPLQIEELSRNALEAAIQLREGNGGKVTALSFSRETIRKTIKEALAMGADEGVIVTSEMEPGPDVTARVLGAVLRGMEFDLLILGEGSADNYSCQVGPRLGEMLDMPLATYVREIEVADNGLMCVRDMEECREAVLLPTPSIITVTNEINEPRLPSLPAILKASKKPLREIRLSELGIPEESLRPTVEVRSNKAPVIDRKRVVFEGELDEVVSEMASAIAREVAR
ncbi:MAG: electron transfer flavoprotein subunit beta/FixA family protein [Thermoplasmata archaeon]